MRTLIGQRAQPSSHLRPQGKTHEQYVPSEARTARRQEPAILGLRLRSPSDRHRSVARGGWWHPFLRAVPLPAGLLPANTVVRAVAYLVDGDLRSPRSLEACHLFDGRSRQPRNRRHQRASGTV
jgi:hypothetical protein